MKHVKLKLAFLLTACLWLGQLSSLSAQRVDRWPEIIDTSTETGTFTARFVQLQLAKTAQPGDKSGDSTILVSPDGQVMLLDAGAPGCETQVMAVLDGMGVKTIHALVASHPHVDHVGGFPPILAAYDVKKVYMSRLEYPSATAQRFISAVKAKGGEVVYLEQGDEFNFGDQVQVRVLNPEKNIQYYDGYPKNSTQFVNDKSLVMQFTYGAAKMLFMGDLYCFRELELVEQYGALLQADVLKVGHHGSDTSSSKTFIKTVKPKVAVMMGDVLASRSVYAAYTKAGAATYITYIDGCVKVTVGKDGDCTWITQYDRVKNVLE